MEIVENTNLFMILNIKIGQMTCDMIWVTVWIKE